MDQSRNPYAPSRATLSGSSAHGDAQLWRSQNVLVMNRDGDLPARCVKCNEPVDAPAKQRKLYWHHPGIYALLLINIIVYAIVAMIVRKTVKVSPGLCSVHRQKRTRSIWFGWGSLFIGIVLMIVVQDAGRVIGVMLITLGCIIASILMSRIVYAKRIDNAYIQLKGCGEEFLAQLPEFPPGTRNS